jgi:hypothetical protein
MRVAFPALLASICWTMFSLCKFGTTDNHWLEPSLAAVILIARAPVPRLRPSRRSALVIMVAAIQIVVTASIGVRSSVEAVWLAPRRASVIARARRICGAGPADVVMAPDVGIEYAMNGRILTTPFEMTYLARRGAYPLALWMADVVGPHVRGLVMENDVLDRSSRAAPSYDRLDPPLRELLARTFVLAEEGAGLRVYCRRSDRPERPRLPHPSATERRGDRAQSRLVGRTLRRVLQVLAGRRDDLARLGAVGGADDALALHLLDHAGRAVVADLQPALDE